MSISNEALNNSIPTTTTDDNQPQQEIPTFLQSAGVVTKLFFAGLAALGGIASFCVGITFTPFSPDTGIAAFAIGTSLFGLAGVLFFTGLNQATTPSLSSRDIQNLA